MSIIPGKPISDMTALSAVDGVSDYIPIYDYSDSADPNKKITPRSMTYSNQSLTIAGGIITVTIVTPIALITLDTQGGAGTDDLDTLTPAYAGQIIILRCTDNARNVVVKHGTGNIYINGAADFTLDNTADRIMLMSTGATMYGIAPGSNNS